MFERFTDASRYVIIRAQNEAKNLRHPYIGTEHFLLAYFDEFGTEPGIPSRALESLGASHARVLGKIDETISRGETESSPRIPFTPNAKRMIVQSLREAGGLGQHVIEPEHLLIALTRGDEVGDPNSAIVLLTQLGVDAVTVRTRVLELLAADS